MTQEGSNLLSWVLCIREVGMFVPWL